MIGLFDDAGARLPITYNGVTLNSPTDNENDIIEVAEAVGGTTYDAVTDPRQLIDGMEAYPARKIARSIVIRGTVRAPTIARLYDRMEALAVAFDPALASLNNASTYGFLAFDFSVPTLDLTNYPSGLIPSRYYIRTLKPIDPPDSRYIGTSQHYEMTLLCRDPRRYLQSTSSLADAGTAANTKADYISWPTVTITMSGAGSATYQVTNSTLGKSVYLDLSGRTGGDVVAVDMELKKVTINGTENNGIVGASTQWWWIKPGNNTIAITNGTNASTSSVWRPAFVL